MKHMHNNELPNNIHHTGMYIHQTLWLPYMWYKGYCMDLNSRDTLQLIKLSKFKE